MKTTKLPRALTVFAAALGLAGAALGAEVSFSTNGPRPGREDISNFTGANTENDNVEDGDHDATYIADDRPIQGQTFTTGANSAGYQLKAVTLREVQHETYALVPHLTYTVRITKPKDGSLSVIAAEEVKVAANAPGNIPSIGDGSDTGTGSGKFITFTLDKPVTLQANTTYGFDVGGASKRHYWQTDGTASNPYAGGMAYSVEDRGKLTPRKGDHVFIVSLTAAKTESPTQITVSPGKKPANQSAATTDKASSSE